ncbi:unnamed protein product [Rotaria socialis]|uniref:Uncharacterized protein n=1 Tax=Rotaria socialis TaxID=392032 RepID=A0A818A2X2_9BILA|nr:unnamed protein product [Rotaria socialis]CAF4565674.1 unnamed protein product [Rotaria socialis]
MQNSLMDIVMNREFASLTCNQGLRGEPVQCNDKSFSERNQIIGLTTSNAVHKNDSPTCQLTKSSLYVAIIATKISMDDRIMLSRQIWIACSKYYCNSKETMDRIESIAKKNHYIAFYQQ